MGEEVWEEWKERRSGGRGGSGGVGAKRSGGRVGGVSEW